MPDVLEDSTDIGNAQRTAAAAATAQASTVFLLKVTMDCSPFGMQGFLGTERC
jgi:hypothetical protein